MLYVLRHGLAKVDVGCLHFHLETFEQGHVFTFHAFVDALLIQRLKGRACVIGLFDLEFVRILLFVQS